ncbi:MAG: response regulator [Acidobacteriota bacterium]|nr:response regulator [Acidobacteriota bacterium]
MKDGAKVLLIDDNPAIRELMLDSLASEMTVHTCSGATEALDDTEIQAPDLVISDYRMPGVNGLELIGKLRAAHPHLPVVMMASRADINGPLAGAGRQVEEFLEKPFLVDHAILRIRRVLDRIALSKATREATNSTSVRGTLAQMSVIDLLQTIDMGRKNCRLKLSQRGQPCEMIFHEGQLVHATMGNLSGEEAVYKVAGWSEGSFQIDFERIECEYTIHHSTQSVLLEALRLFDEAQRDGSEDGEEAIPHPGPGDGLSGASLSAAGD